jgi:hypothetical protein
VFGFFLWEMVKMALSVAMLIAAPRLITALSWPAMLVGLVVTMKAAWLAVMFSPRRRKQETSNGMAAENAAEHGQTAGEYIVHHLTHLQSSKPAGVADLSVFNFDSLFFSILLGILGCWLLWLAARKATSGVPGRFQAAVESWSKWSTSRPRASCTTPRAASSSRRWR